MSLQNPSYLSLSRHNIYYFRWPLPEALREKGRTTHIKLSLQTRDPKEALRLANMLAYHADVIVKSDCVGGMDYIEVKSLLEAYFADLLAEQKRLIDKDGPFNQRRIHRLRQNIAYMQDDKAFETGEQLMQTFAPDRDASDAKNVLNTLDMNLAVESIGYERVQDLFRPAALAYFQRLIEYSESQKQFNFDASVNGLPVIDARPIAGFTRPEHRLKNVVTKYVAEMDRAQAWGRADPEWQEG